MSTRRASRHQRTQERRRRLIIWSIVGAAAGLLILAIVWVGVRGWLAYGELQTARASVSTVQAQLLEDPAAAEAAIASLGEHTSKATDLTSDPIWRAFETLPWVGNNLEAFRVTAWSLDTVVRSVAAPLAGQVLSVQESLTPVDGRINTTVLRELQPVSQQSADAMQDVLAAMRGVDTDSLVPPLAEAVAEFDGMLDPIAEGVGAVHGATTLLPAMLGADGQRDTLLLFLNNAELRSTVGIPGSFAVIRAEDGAMQMVQQASTRDFPKLSEPIFDLPEDVWALYRDWPGQWIQNVTYVPEFWLSGELASAMWEQRFGTRPQSVLAIDPVTLSYLLDATGPLELSTGDVLTSENAVDLLLHEVYLRYENPADQDAFFAEASERVFNALSSGQFDSTKLVAGLARGVQEDRVKLWSALPEEQTLIERTALGGSLPKGAPGEGVFTMQLNDSTGSKMDYYLESEASVSSDLCVPDGELQTITVRYTLTNTAPADAANLPSYITGGGNFGVAPGNISTLAYLFAPEGLRLIASDADQVQDGGILSSKFHERSLVGWNPVLGPGESSTLELVYEVRGGPIDTVAWRQTPTFYHTVTEEVAKTC